MTFACTCSNSKGLRRMEFEIRSRMVGQHIDSRPWFKHRTESIDHLLCSTTREDTQSAETAGSDMTRSTENVLSPSARRFVLLLLASCGPLLLPAFLLSSVPPPRQTSPCFLRQASTGTAPGSATSRGGAASSSANSCYYANRIRNTGHGHKMASTATSGRLAVIRTAPRTISGLSAAAHQPPHRSVVCSTTAHLATTTTTRSSSSSSRRSLIVLGARGGGRSGGDSSRRRTDRPDEYSRDRKKGKGRGGRGGRSGGRGSSSGGGGSSSSGGGTTASGAPSPFEAATDGGERWGGESRLSTLDDRAPAEFSRKIDCSELSRKPK